MREPGKEHVIAVVFFTPDDWKSNETSQSLLIQAGPVSARGDFEDGMIIPFNYYMSLVLSIKIYFFDLIPYIILSLNILVPQKGEAFVYNCPYSSLCRQVVIDEEGRVKNFRFKDMANPTVELVVCIYVKFRVVVTK